MIKTQQEQTPNFLILAPRSLTLKEQQKVEKQYGEVGMKVSTDAKLDENLIRDRKDLTALEQDTKDKLQQVFADRVELKKKFHDKQHAVVIQPADQEMSEEKPSSPQKVVNEAESEQQPAVSEEEDDYF